jgi:hypothetical protein
MSQAVNVKTRLMKKHVPKGKKNVIAPIFHLKSKGNSPNLKGIFVFSSPIIKMPMIKINNPNLIKKNP